ncbi:MAG: 5-formyltetrahydrofolate cyclo-ligase [Campylobacterota bacterium]|nr:5-formyltetrahydrofolate cyclo-ligase [Campylobacterota bacterium]
MGNLKSDFRKSCIKRLTFVGTNISYVRHKIIVKNLEFLIDNLNKKNILLYIPFKKMEVNVQPLINTLRKKRIKVYVPLIKGDSFTAVPYRFPLQKRRFGIKEPNNSLQKVKLDLAIVPIVGVDKYFKRIGFGAGMYDRFFHRLNYTPTIIFTQLTMCKSAQHLSNQYDISSDYLITY